MARHDGSDGRQRHASVDGHPSSEAPRAPVRALVHQRPHTELEFQVRSVTETSFGEMPEYTHDGWRMTGARTPGRYPSTVSRPHAQLGQVPIRV